VRLARWNRSTFDAIALGIVTGLFSTSCSTPGSLQGDDTTESIPSFRTLADGKQWTTENLGIDIADSYCHGDAGRDCGRYGRLYTWESAQRGCRSLGGGWRLPTEDDWRQLARQFGGAFGDSQDGGKTAYTALLSGGESGFDGLLGGGRALDGRYDDLEAHGFYWTASESAPATAWFYNFGRGGGVLYRQDDGEKQLALSARCVREQAASDEVERR
jgi:uncharacterized protein (TIGR02145 family)